MGIKIMNLMPITADVMTPEIFAYMCKYLEPTTEVITDQIKTGPVTIECEYDDALAAPAVLELCKKAELNGFDGIFINCFAEPGVRAAREYVKIPVYGGFEPAAHIALGLADRISIVTVVPNVVPRMEGNVAHAHLDKRFVSVRNVNIPVEEIGDHEKLCQALVKESLAAIREDGAQGIVLGCTGFVGVAERIKTDLLAENYDVPVIEAAQAALKMLELHAKMGLRHSRLTYMTPPEK